MPAISATEQLRSLCEPPAGTVPKVGLDTCCVQYYINNPPVQPWADCLDPLFRAALDGKVELYVSTVVVSELLAHLHFANRNNGYDPELDLLSILNRHFQVLEVCGEVARAAGRLRGHFAPSDKMVLKTPDALIGATSLQHNHTCFVTNDSQLADALPPGNCIYLKDVALDWLGQGFPDACLADKTPVTPQHRGPGLPGNAAPATLELRSIRPDPSAKWRRILKDAPGVAVAVGEPCIFFVLTARNGRREETKEVLFWHAKFAETRPPDRIMRRLHEHLGYSRRTGHAANPRNHIHVFVATSLTRARHRQDQNSFASRSDQSKMAHAWTEYLGILDAFRSALKLPQATWLLLEDGVAKRLDPPSVVGYLERAANVLGLNGGRR